MRRIVLIGCCLSLLAPSPVSAAPPKAPVAQVLMLDDAFEPRQIHTSVGFGGIHWENVGVRIHTATTVEAPSWLDLQLDEGESGDTQAAYAGRFPLVCIYHEEMTGSLRVAPTVTPPGGDLGQTFTVTVAMDAPADDGFSVDLQRRRNKGRWVAIGSTDQPIYVVTPKRPGDYRIRVRLVEGAEKSGWSPGVGFLVSAEDQSPSSLRTAGTTSVA